MTAHTAVDDTIENAERTGDSARDTLRGARAVFESGRRAVPELARNAQRVLSDRVDRLGGHARDAVESAGDQLDTARLYVVERVQERPLAVTFGALAAGFVLGMLFAGSRR